MCSCKQYEIFQGKSCAPIVAAQRKKPKGGDTFVAIVPGHTPHRLCRAAGSHHFVPWLPVAYSTDPSKVSSDPDLPLPPASQQELCLQDRKRSHQGSAPTVALSPGDPACWWGPGWEGPLPPLPRPPPQLPCLCVLLGHTHTRPCT